MSDDEELDVFSNLNKFLNVTPNQYRRQMEEFALDLSDNEQPVAEVPITPSPVKPKVKPRTRQNTAKKLTPEKKQPAKEVKVKKTRAQLRLEKIKADLAAFASPEVPNGISPPKMSKPSPPKKRTRQKKDDTIDLTSCVPVTMGFVNLDSDDESSSKPLVPAVDEADLSFESENYEISIHIRFNGNYEKFTHRNHQKFEDLMKTLAQREKVDIKHIYLDFEDKFLEAESTPHSIGYTAGKFICGRVLALERTKPQKAKKDPNLINVKIQSQSFKKPLLMKIMKNEPFKIVFIKLAEELKCQPGKISLKFDGDKVLMDQTPNDIELEGGEILDLIVEK